MDIRPLEETAAYVETTVSTLPVQATSAAEMLDLYLEVCIQVLDSECGNYPSGALESYLKKFLHDKEVSLGRRRVKGPNSRQQ
jgi:hypothetical protein